MAHRVVGLIAGLFFSFFSLTGCTRTIVREELQIGLVPLLEQTADVQRRLAEIENKQVVFEEKTADALGLVGRGLNALSIQNLTLQQQVDGMESSTATQLEKLGDRVEAAKKVAATAGKNALAAKKAAAQADLNSQLGIAEVGAQLDAGEIRTIRRVGVTEASRVSGEQDTRDILGAVIRTEEDATRGAITTDGAETRAEVAAKSEEIQSAVKVAGDATRALTLKEASDTRTHVTTEAGDLRTKVEDQAKKILEALKLLKPTAPVPPTASATP